ncbi:MAG TPA: thioredoxin domain-containing protein [Phycisphaerae bacterium]|nr:thioredoxin domain-containing protein [Phycisphaerae bacterium]
MGSGSAMHPGAGDGGSGGEAEGGGRRAANRLIESTSPYLLQHAHNPVDWYPWGEEAFAKARAEGKPIFLSIGYSACHWCHVMEREVFEKPAIAEVMNAHFVNIKVDREERPDVDDVYMLATQLMTGSGGWPMSVWLTPELKPFYAGTYFPPEDGAHGRPGFVRLEKALAEAWANRRGELLEQARRVAEAVHIHADEGGGAGAGPVDMAAWAVKGLEEFADRFDEAHGGLGGAPKFPPHQALALWLTMLRHPNAAQLSQEEVAAVEMMVAGTLDGMMNGGIYDQVGGGFARYSTDEKWLVPHFEKMLYDNAQLAAVYGLAAAHFGRGDYARVARQTLDFWLREMTGERGGGGGFYSTLDADSEGAEGKFYVWTVADVRAALGDGAGGDDAALMMEHFGVTEAGNWHESPVPSGNVLSVVRDVETLARERGVSVEAMRGRIDGLLVKMREWRARRVPPGLDDKVLTSWNGLMISALAICGRVLREPRYLEAAHRGMGFLLTEHMEGGRRLLRVSRGKNTKHETRNTKLGPVASGSAHTDGFLEDHAFLLNGMMDLIESTTATSLPGTMARKRALELADVMVKHFEDPEKGAFFFTSRKHEVLFARIKNAADNATPSANGMAIRALLRLAAESGREEYREKALRAVGAFAATIGRRPDFFPTILQALVEDMEARTRGVGGARETLPIRPALVDVGHGAGGGSKVLSVNAHAGKVADGKFEVLVELTLAEGYHVQPHHPQDREAFATVARVRGDLPLAKQEWTYPAGGEEDHAYEGNVRMIGACTLGGGAAGVKPGKYPMRATVLAQPCSGASCLAPEKVSAEFVVEVP